MSLIGQGSEGLGSVADFVYDLGKRESPEMTYTGRDGKFAVDPLLRLYAAGKLK